MLVLTSSMLGTGLIPARWDVFGNRFGQRLEHRRGIFAFFAESHDGLEIHQALIISRRVVANPTAINLDRGVGIGFDRGRIRNGLGCGDRGPGQDAHVGRHRPPFERRQLRMDARHARATDGDDMINLTIGQIEDIGPIDRWNAAEELGDIPVHRTNRGGQVTSHGPGQVVAYVLVDLRRHHIYVKEFVFRIEAAVLDTLAHYGVTGHRVRSAPGIYVRLADPRAHTWLRWASKSATTALTTGWR